MRFLLGFTLVAAGGVLITDDARACGGCFPPVTVQSQTESTVVTGHRMVLSVSTAQTVLWDQIQYSGNPKDFAWVLPVKQGARIELGTDAWFETLDAATEVHVVSPPLTCPGPPSAAGSGCGSKSFAASADFSAGAGAGAPEGSGVTIVHQGTVGPYETVTLSATNPKALNAWLDDHGYAVGAAEQPVIDAYVTEGFDFIALRLQPGEGVRQMKPVRVISPGGSPALPLRMVAAGTGADVAIVLFVIGEGRWETANFPNGAVPLPALSWDYLASDSNYALLRRTALAANGGATWITPYAERGALLSFIANPNQPYDYNGNYEPGGLTGTIGDTYFTQAQRNNEVGGVTCVSTAPLADSADLVVDTCAAKAPPGSCPDAETGKLAAKSFACGTADDLAVALTGMHPKDVWVTRLEADLPHLALGTDLSLQASATQAAALNWVKPAITLHEQEVCRAAADKNGGAVALFSSSDGGDRGGGRRIMLDVAALAFAAAALRRALRGKKPLAGFARSGH